MKYRKISRKLSPKEMQIAKLEHIAEGYKCELRVTQGDFDNLKHSYRELSRQCSEIKAVSEEREREVLRLHETIRILGKR